MEFDIRHDAGRLDVRQSTMASMNHRITRPIARQAVGCAVAQGDIPFVGIPMGRVGHGSGGLRGSRWVGWVTGVGCGRVGWGRRGRPPVPRRSPRPGAVRHRAAGKSASIGRHPHGPRIRPYRHARGHWLTQPPQRRNHWRFPDGQPAPSAAPDTMFGGQRPHGERPGTIRVHRRRHADAIPAPSTLPTGRAGLKSVQVSDARA